MNTHAKRVVQWKTVVESLLTEADGLATLRRELANAEATGELSEFYVLSFHAVASTIDDSEFAPDYLEMAEAVASSPCELATAAENWAAYELRKGDFHSAAGRCLTALERFDQTAGLWRNLLLALHELGEMDTIDFILRGFAQMVDRFTAELVQSLATQPRLRCIHARPAFRDLVTRRGSSLAVPCHEFHMDIAAGEISAPRSAGRSQGQLPLADNLDTAFTARLVTFLQPSAGAGMHPVMQAAASENTTFDNPVAKPTWSAPPAVLLPLGATVHMCLLATSSPPPLSVDAREGRRGHDTSACEQKRSHDRARKHYRDLQEAIQYGYIDLGVAPVEVTDW